MVSALTELRSALPCGPVRARTMPGSPRDWAARRAVSRRIKPSGMCLAIPAQVIGLSDERNRIAVVEVAGVQRNVNVGLLDGEARPVEVGDWVLVHVGFAISRVDEEEAALTRRLLERMGAEYEQELAELKASAIE